METTPDELWSPDSVDPYNLVPNLAAMQDTVQDALTAAERSLSFRSGPTTERNALASPAARNGVYWADTTDGLLYRHNGSTWVVSAPLATQQTLGAAIAGITVSATATVPRLAIKSGQLTAFGTAAFGNQYMDAVTFSQPFPTALMSVQILQIQTDGAVAYPTVAIDNANAAGFRAFYPGSSGSIKRSFLWTAFGY